jgi:hypothetical protein
MPCKAPGEKNKSVILLLSRILTNLSENATFLLVLSCTSNQKYQITVQISIAALNQAAAALISIESRHLPDRD